MRLGSFIFWIAATGLSLSGCLAGSATNMEVLPAGTHEEVLLDLHSPAKGRLSLLLSTPARPPRSVMAFSPEVERFVLKLASHSLIGLPGASTSGEIVLAQPVSAANGSGRFTLMNLPASDRGPYTLYAKALGEEDVPLNADADADGFTAIARDFTIRVLGLTDLGILNLPLRDTAFTMPGAGLAGTVTLEDGALETFGRPVSPADHAGDGEDDGPDHLELTRAERDNTVGKVYSAYTTTGVARPKDATYLGPVAIDMIMNDPLNPNALTLNLRITDPAHGTRVKKLFFTGDDSAASHTLVAASELAAVPAERHAIDPEETLHLLFKRSADPQGTVAHRFFYKEHDGGPKSRQTQLFIGPTLDPAVTAQALLGMMLVEGPGGGEEETVIRIERLTP